MKIVENRKKFFAASLIVIIIGFAAMIFNGQAEALSSMTLNLPAVPLSTWIWVRIMNRKICRNSSQM